MFDYKIGDAVRLLSSLSMKNPMVGMIGIIIDICFETNAATILWSNDKIETLHCWEVCRIIAR